VLIAVCEISIKLVEKAKNLASDVLSSGLLMVHDTGRGGENDEAELTRRQQSDNPFLKITQLDVIVGANNTGLVETSIELDNYLPRAVVIDLFEFANVAMFLHHTQELDDNLRARPDQNLALTSPLGIVDTGESVVKN